MNPKVLSIYNNAKIFLSEKELRELAICIDKQIGKHKVETKEPKNLLLANWTPESVTERLLATHFKKKSTKIHIQQ